MRLSVNSILMNILRTVPALIILAFAGQPDPAMPLDAAAWREDLKFLAAELPAQHLKAFHTISREEWDRRVRELDEAIPTLDETRIVIRMAALVAAVGDAHTSLDARGRMSQYPVQLKGFPEGVFAVGATPEHTDLLGARLVSIDGTNADKARDAVGALATRENDVMYRMQTTRLLAVPEVLHAFGVTSSAEQAVYALETSTGGVKRTLTPMQRGQPVSWKLPGALTAESGPVYLKDQRVPYWWKALDDGAIVYVAYNQCLSEPKRPFGEFAKEVMDAAAGRQRDSEAAKQGGTGQGPGAGSPQAVKVVIDLRNNGGGNSAIAMPLIAALRENEAVNQRGRLFVLIGARTQSSGMMNALQLRKATKAILIGEPTGGRPNSYGEMKELKLPRSGLTVWYSTKYFRQIAGEDPPSLMPDEQVEPTAAEFFAGKDPVMERVRAWE
jgi:Peptidase family S41